MIYLVGRAVVDSTSIPFFSGTRREMVERMLTVQNSEIEVFGTDEINTFVKVLDFLQLEYRRVVGGPNSQIYDNLDVFEDPMDNTISFDSFIALFVGKNKDIDKVVIADDVPEQVESE